MENRKKHIRKIFFKDHGNDEVTESLRLIRTNLEFMRRDKAHCRMIAVTSSTPAEGKSFISSNYAMSIAISGKKVLLIDCDVRRPRIHAGFEIGIEAGLESILLGNKRVEDVIIKDIEKNLDLIPAKALTNNVTELFLGDAMAKLLEEMKKKYDTIILDTPPLMVASDGAILGSQCDGVVFVVAYDQISKKELEYSKHILENAGANVYGFIVNKVEKSGYSYGNAGYYTNNYRYYQDYYKDGVGNKKEQKGVWAFIKRHLTGDQKGGR